MRSILMVVAISAAVLPAIARGDENRQQNEKTEKARALIEKLANDVSEKDSANDIRLEADSKLIHTTHNSEMLKAWLELRDLGADAFPEVVKHLDDKRKSFTMDTGST